MVGWGNKIGKGKGRNVLNVSFFFFIFFFSSSKSLPPSSLSFACRVFVHVMGGGR